MFNDLCHTKYRKYNSSENSLKFSGFMRNRKIQKGNLRSAEGSQISGQTASSSVEATSQAQTTSQTCDFMSGLHYAIPFLSDRLKSSLLNRLRCQSEPRDTADGIVSILNFVYAFYHFFNNSYTPFIFFTTMVMHAKYENKCFVQENS